MLPVLLNNGGEWGFSGYSRKTKHPLVRKVVEYNGVRFVVVFEIRKKRKMLALETFYVGVEQK